MKQQELDPNTVPKKVIQDISTRWNSSYYMMQHLLVLQYLSTLLLRWTLSLLFSQSTQICFCHQPSGPSLEIWSVS